MNLRQSPKRVDNRGLTLVELLVAVVILGIIVSPLLHAFVTSARTAQKSRQYGDATTAAQNIIERIEATDLDALLVNASVLDGGAQYYVWDDDDGKYVPSASPVKDAASRYYLGMPVSSGPSAFDALITLDASNDLNDEPVTQYTELIATSQSTGVDNPDSLARSEFETDLASLSGTSPTLSRVITITVEPGEVSGGTTRYPISIEYTYTGGFISGIDGTYHGFFKTFSSDSYYTAASGVTDPTEPVFSMFFFFDTFYSTYGFSHDTVKVYNNRNAYESGGAHYDLRFNLFLVRQKTTTDPAALGALEASYTARILQYENENAGLGQGVDETGSTYYMNACKVYTNMNTNLSTGGDISDFSYLVSRGPLWYYAGTEEPRLVVSDIIDRLIYVNVRLFEAGEAASGFTGAALASMDATKLD